MPLLEIISSCICKRRTFSEKNAQKIRENVGDCFFFDFFATKHNFGRGSIVGH